MKTFARKIADAVHGCRIQALLIFVVYCLSCVVGIVQVHTGSDFALRLRDKIVGDVSTSETATQYQAGNGLSAAYHDFVGNLFLAAVPQTVAGLGVVFPFVSVPYQGWVGGIVSVDGGHQSRLTRLPGAAYYVIVVLLQFIPFSLSIGAGVKCGLETYRANSAVGWKFWQFRFSWKALLDVAYVYALAVPLFFIASCIEFLSSWNV